ncbi:C6 zinc finger domain protein [Apiospora hydei]|uniref:C6 zinc finger domain protein n=1 Tax=Apiospora hydei TaxID=1337664 RepID=A0ABR1VHN5_9PEZI
MSWTGGVYGDYASGSESASGSTYDSGMNSPIHSSGITQYSPGSASMSPHLSSSSGYFDTNLVTASAPDSATVLLIITCYVHVLRLHVALFWHIQQDLQRASDANKTHGVCQFGNIPLQSGNLQITMVIQLVTNAFERMEGILGLPSELSPPLQRF